MESRHCSLPALVQPRPLPLPLILPASFGWMLGVAGQLQAARLGAGGFEGPLVALALMLLLALLRWNPPDVPARRRPSRRWLAVSAVVLSGLMLAWSTTQWRARHRLQERLDPALAWQTLEVTGLVTDLPVVSAEGGRFEFDIETAQWSGDAAAADLVAAGRVPRHAMLSMYPSAEDNDDGFRTDLPRAGQRWRLAVRLHAPDGLVNPHGPDPTLWLFERGVRAVGTVAGGRRAPVPALLAETGTSRIDRWRQDLRDRLRHDLGESPASGVLAALTVGDQAAIDRADWTVLRLTGVAHLVSISGLHVTLFAWGAAAVLNRLWRWRSAWLLRWPAPVVARWGGVACATAYALVAGWGVPAQRTLLMLAVAAALRGGALRWSGARVLMVTALVVTVWDPWAMLQPGFWLSFVAVALLMGSGPQPGPVEGAGWWHGLSRHARELWRSQWVVTVGLAPWTLIFFQQVSLAGLLANAMAIPVVTLLVTPLALFGLVFSPLWMAAAWAIEVLMHLLGVLAAQPWAAWGAPAAPLWAQVLAVLGAAGLVVPWPWTLRLMCLPLMLPMLWPALDHPPAGEFDLLAADIGQGNAVLIRTAGHSLLYDTGPAYARHAEAGNAGERVLVPLLRALGVQRLDRVVVSHRDTDHSGGAGSVLRALPVTLLQSSLEPEHPLRHGAVPHQRCEAGTRWVWDGVVFEFLHPEASDLERSGLSVLRPNAVCCVLRISARTRRALLTGDIGVDQELRLLIRQLDSLPADVLLVPHHGSNTSSEPNFLDRVRPQWALVQAGRHNRYGHPASRVMARYAERGIPVIRTSQCGAWHWNSADAAQWCARKWRRRYWWDDPEDDGPEIAKSDHNAQPPP